MKNAGEFALPARASELIRRTLVDERRTHLVVRDDAHALLLENRAPRPPASAPTTYGWGWVGNVGRRPVRASVD